MTFIACACKPTPLCSLRCGRFSAGRPRILQSCASALEASKTTPFGARLAENPMFRDVTQRLARMENPTRRELIELQSDLNSLNLFGHYLSRTRKREVEEKRLLREARVVPCFPTEDEIEFYNRVTEICRGAYSRMHDSTMGSGLPP